MINIYSYTLTLIITCFKYSFIFFYVFIFYGKKGCKKKENISTGNDMQDIRSLLYKVIID
jgi:hypothetical protein